jgi:delta-aminolevulinic acid dehydratase/porphobilinogen synthase
MLKAAAQNGWIDEQQVVLETLMSFKRATKAGFKKSPSGWKVGF